MFLLCKKLNAFAHSFKSWIFPYILCLHLQHQKTAKRKNSDTVSISETLLWWSQQDSNL